MRDHNADVVHGDDRNQPPDPPTAIIPMRQVPVELLKRCLKEHRGDLATLPPDYHTARKRLADLIAELQDLIAQE